MKSRKYNNTVVSFPQVEDFVPLKPDAVSENTTSNNSNFNSGDQYGFAHIPNVLNALETKFSFTVSLFSLIGYIIISAFGQMNTFAKFVGYLVFLILNYIMYLFLSSSGIKIQLKDIQNNRLIIIIILLVIFIIYQNFSWIFNLLTSIFNQVSSWW